MNTTHKLLRFHIGLDKEGEDFNTAAVTRLKRAHDAREIIARAYEAFTATSTTGTWRGTQEPAFTVEVYVENDEREIERARAVARELRETLEQEAVGLGILPAAFELH